MEKELSAGETPCSQAEPSTIKGVLVQLMEAPNREERTRIFCCFQVPVRDLPGRTGDWHRADQEQWLMIHGRGLG